MVNHRRGPWSQAEDMYLLQLVQRDGASNWVRISHSIQTRSPKQCRERYHQNLKPSLNHDPITPEEGEQIEKMVNEMGKRWAEIARRLNGRSDNAVKNWWNGGQNRRRRGVEDRQHLEDRQQEYRLRNEKQYSVTETDVYGRVPQFVNAPEHKKPYFHSDPKSVSFARPLHKAQDSMYPTGHDQSYYGSAPTLTSIYAPSNGSYRPSPLSLQLSAHSIRSSHIETPMPSPAVSIVSADGGPPSLITDVGSESRSPLYVSSPGEAYTLPPTIGSRDERRRSSIRFLPKTGFASDDDDCTLAPIATPKGVDGKAGQLPSPSLMMEGAPVHILDKDVTRLPSPRVVLDSPVFREPDYQSKSDESQACAIGLPSPEGRKMALSAILA